MSLPAIAEEDDPLRRAPGEALWPQRYPLQVLQSIRAHSGSAVWTALYQQNPVAAEGQVFKRDWWRSYTDAPSSFDRIVMSAATAFKTGAEADYSAMTVWGQTQAAYYLLPVWRGRAEFPELKRQAIAMAAVWSPTALLVEDRASGQSLVQELQRETSLPVLPISIDKDKVTRAQAITPLVEAGKVFLPASAPWLSDYLDELSSFPATRHDDQVDSTTKALNWMRTPPEPGILGYYRILHEEQHEWGEFYGDLCTVRACSRRPKA